MFLYVKYQSFSIHQKAQIKPMANPNSAVNMEFSEKDENTPQKEDAATAKKTVMEKPTPMMAQFMEIKKANPDCLLFYRMGDFYELFFEDAVEASKALNITLTKRGKHQGADIPMCGVPVRAAYDYLEKLITLGFRVAICEQMEDPSEAKKRGSKSVVKRDVVRLVTAGTLTEETLLETGAHNYLMSVAHIKSQGDRFSCAWIDISTGDFFVSETSLGGLPTLIARLDPGEIILPQSLFEDTHLRDLWLEHDKALMPLDKSFFDSAQAERKIKNLFNVSALDGFGEFERGQISACGALADYIALTQKSALPSLKPPKSVFEASEMQIDAATRKNLELVRGMNGGTEGTLLSSIDKTVTSFGARELRARLSAPSTDPDLIKTRLDAVEYFHGHISMRQMLREKLKSISDIERCLSRTSLGRGTPRDLKALALSLEQITLLAQNFDTESQEHSLPDDLIECLGKLQMSDNGLGFLLRAALAEDVPLQARDGGFVAPGYMEELDRARDLRDQSKKIIAGLQATYSEKTGVKNLKIKHNNVLGYFIEVTAQHAAALEEDKELFFHRQSLANNMRFSTAELASLEERILAAADKALSMEMQVFDELVRAVITQSEALLAYSHALSSLDVSSSLAQIAEVENFCRPIVDESSAFSIEKGRHPVVEQALKRAAENSFVPNSINLSRETSALTDDADPNGALTNKYLWLLTGPNMAGKSTFLRQNALITILAQMGSFVPAHSAHIGVVDRLFSRVGASDDLARGRSTFMVEMVETATILNQSTEKSLVILDEIGRGTSTFDGLSIAWACLEHLHHVNMCRTVFATHFHELTSLSSELPYLGNATMKVKEWEGDVIFLHEIGAGTAEGSYGIQVAKLAGLPRAVLDRARDVLGKLEESGGLQHHENILSELPLFSADVSADQTSPVMEKELIDALENLSPDDMTPLQALEALYELKALGPNKKN